MPRSKKSSSAGSKRSRRFELSGPVVITAPPEIEASSDGDGGDSEVPSFGMTAYTGVPMQVGYFPHGVVVDLDGVRGTQRKVPIYMEHDKHGRVGHATEVSVDGSEIKVSGKVSGMAKPTDAALEFVRLAEAGYEWQASIGATAEKVEDVGRDVEVTVNGAVHRGPLHVIRQSKLLEISVVSNGADDATSSKLAASAAEGDDAMKFNAWLEKHGFADASEDVRASLRSVWEESIEASEREEQSGVASDDGESSGGDAADEHQPVTATARRPAASTVEASAGDDWVAGHREERVAEYQRIDQIVEACGGRYPEIQAQAIREGWSPDRTRTEVKVADRPSGRGVRGDVRSSQSAAVIEAAVCVANGLDGVEDQFGERTLQAAEDVYGGSIGRHRMLLEAAIANGYSGNALTFREDAQGILQAAFSTTRLSGILSNVANKFMVAGFMSIEDTWKQIAATRSVSDFKESPGYRMTGSMMFQELGPDGELEYATVDEQEYGNRASTYGIMFGISRDKIFDDDLGFITAIPRRIGLGGAKKLNRVFWTEFLDNAAFFTAGNNNLLTGAGSVLDIDGLTAAETEFYDQVDEDDEPLGLEPELLLVPNALNVPATQLMRSTDVRVDGAAAELMYGTNNPHGGKFRVVRSSYLNKASIPGGSATAWWLLADPAVLAAIEVVFLNNRRVPYVETVEVRPDQLGIAMRGYHDFGVRKQEPKAAVKSAGA